MSDKYTDRRCGTCHHFDPVSRQLPRSSCDFPLPAVLPFWIRWALDKTREYVEPHEGTECDAWQQGRVDEPDEPDDWEPGFGED